MLSTKSKNVLYETKSFFMLFTLLFSADSITYSVINPEFEVQVNDEGASRNMLQSNYESFVQRTREKVSVRDSDVIISSYPKSGTHFIAAVVSAILNDSGRKILRAKRSFFQSYSNHTYAGYFFHTYPIFVLLPDNFGRKVPDILYEFVDQVPKTLTRIFLVQIYYVRFFWIPCKHHIFKCNMQGTVFHLHCLVDAPTSDWPRVQCNEPHKDNFFISYPSSSVVIILSIYQITCWHQ